MAIPIIVNSTPQSTNVLIPRAVNNRGQRGGGRMATARFTTGPSLPSMPNAGRVIKR